MSQQKTIQPADNEYVLVPKSQVKANGVGAPAPDSIETEVKQTRPQVAQIPRAMTMLLGMGKMGSGGKGGVNMHTGTVSTRLVDAINVTSSAAGNFYNAYNLYTGLQALAEWGSFVTLFRDFRITKVKCTFVPFTPYKVEASINTSGRVVCWAIDPTNSTAPTSVLGLFENENAQVFSNMNADGKMRKWTNPDKKWYSGSSTSNPLQPAMTLKTAIDANVGNTIPLGVIFVEFFVDLATRF